MDNPNSSSQFLTLSRALFSSFALFSVCLPALGKDVFSASQLGPYQFQSSITSIEVVGGNISEVGGFETAAELSDPVVAGVQVQGLVSTDAKMTPNGPATWVQVELRTGDPQFIKYGSLQVVSEVSYELAILGSVSEAELVVAPRAKRNGLGNLTGLLSRARITAQADIKIYETDVLGNRASIFHSWRPENINSPTPGLSNENFSDVVVPFYDRADRITVATNQVYEVLVTSTSLIEFRDITAFDLSAFAYIESSFTTQTPDTELAVSAFGASDVTQESPPIRSTSSTDGESTDAVIAAGARLVGVNEYAENFRSGDTIELIATIDPQSEDIGEAADLFLIVRTENGLFQVSSNAFIDFDGGEEDLIPLSKVSLRAVTEIDLAEALGGITFKDSDTGSYELFLGYATEGSTVTFTEEPVVIEVQP